MDQTSVDAWVARCAQRIMALDQGIKPGEAEEIARVALSIERLRAMTPEAAVDFVAAQLADEHPDRYERRSKPR